MARISTKNQITIPVAALDEVGMHTGERVTVEPAGDGELRIRRATTTFEDAFECAKLRAAALRPREEIRESDGGIEPWWVGVFGDRRRLCCARVAGGGGSVVVQR